MNDGRKRIFFINDEVDLSLLMKTYFLRKNYAVTLFHNTADALALLSSVQPDIIFIATTACEDPQNDIARIRAAAPRAQILVDNFAQP